MGLHAASGIVLASGDLASLVQPPIVGVPAGNYPLISQVGVLLYERNAYLNQPSFTESDINYQTPNQVASPTAALKASEEDWLDKNGTVMIVNPFNGELVKGK